MSDTIDPALQQGVAPVQSPASPALQQGVDRDSDGTQLVPMHKVNAEGELVTEYFNPDPKVIEDLKSLGWTPGA